MQSILREISLLRKSKFFDIDYTNRNRYCVVTNEPNGSKTAYYFSVPIYNLKTRKAVDIKFHTKDEIIYATGSNANITIDNNIRLENAEGSCIISLEKCATLISDYEAVCGKERLYPTTNGVAIKNKDQESYSFSIEVNKPFLEVCANDKSFSFMTERFRPLISISCIGTIGTNENIIAPAKLSYQKITDRKYIITINSCSSFEKSTLIEVNLYENKLFQDTTVESKNPNVNNAFGSIGFIGTTTAFGEQWLYTRPDYSKMAELTDKKMVRIILHLPKLNSDAVELITSKVSDRFCSFGTTWNNKISEELSSIDLLITNHYIDLNLTSVLTDKYGRFSPSKGFILKSQKKASCFSVIATGDNYHTPQILEINYK